MYICMYVYKYTCVYVFMCVYVRLLSSHTPCSCTIDDVHALAQLRFCDIFHVLPFESS